MPSVLVNFRIDVRWSQFAIWIRYYEFIIQTNFHFIHILIMNGERILIIESIKKNPVLLTSIEILGKIHFLHGFVVIITL